ncbi:MAG: MFS transporter [Nitrospirae bacterium]|nr:MAG: MFS transporter [Nitrospirota bacterium]
MWFQAYFPAISQEDVSVWTASTIDRALSDSIRDAALSSIWGALCGGVFLTGFALNVLGAGPQHIGVLAALPTLANLVQLLGSYLIEVTGDRKRLCLIAACLQRSLWLVIVLLPFGIVPDAGDWRVWIMVAIVGISSVCGSLAGIAWTAWMSDVVPEHMRGAYFGKRNMIASAAGLSATLAGGQLLSSWEQLAGSSVQGGFVPLFGFGTLAGLVALWFLARVPDRPETWHSGGSWDLRLFLEPWRDSNFLRLIGFAAATTFALQLAAPFYGVYLIDVLRMDFSTITLLGASSTAATLVMMKLWGPIADHHGNRPIMIVCGSVLALVPLLWLLAKPGSQVVLPVLAAHILTGAASAGLSLSQFNIQLKLSPRVGRSAYLAVFAATVGMAGGVAPVIGGAIYQALLADFHLSFAGYAVTGYHVLFFVSMLLMILCVGLVTALHEVGAAPPYAVILQLRNDLDPQTGISSFMDFAMVEVQRSERFLKELDQMTDELAARSERAVAGLLDRIVRVLERPWAKVKEFLRFS